jgi:hypothetical protein
MIGERAAQAGLIEKMGCRPRGRVLIGGHDALAAR